MEVLKGRCGMRTRSDGASGSCFWFSFPYVPDANTWTDNGTTDGASSFHMPISSATNKNATENAQEATVESTQLRFASFCSDDLEVPEQQKQQQQQQQEPPSPVKKVVLLVDDSTLILKTTSRMLRKEGFKVVTAQNGEEGLHLMKDYNFYFVLTDIQMPVMDGMEMVRRMRQSEHDQEKEQGEPHRPQRIVGMSANSDAETRDDSLICGMNAFIPKPVRMDELLRRVVEMCEEKEGEKKEKS
jgi:CheY-like chemotaxis protein